MTIPCLAEPRCACHAGTSWQTPDSNALTTQSPRPYSVQQRHREVDPGITHVGDLVLGLSQRNTQVNPGAHVALELILDSESRANKELVLFPRWARAAAADRRGINKAPENQVP